ncbi:voltage-gated hydrogen channel 1 [Danio rerio]|uniref:Voltage-gated hydrogen channel 1 n=1 Tax=Danio rerio TaxID=7955 RepID=HVCN1_DANRE|nr:voltage-gated hydrogen channel 1 [Danio rerio]Q6DHQ1.1 RecName: Full=Voltage-gated hydrogen channel 1; AltName: Full=Hydrogen voltage-gated channel 1; Short=HV1 [Danio rerio]AAH75916.1 Zgc:92181 [Danio rerio]|eukprot:NP_001002346.1 voltage-gated hydrogen channel 1 [Danio rerio]
MSRYLKHFTAVGDNKSAVPTWHEEDTSHHVTTLHDAPDGLEVSTGQHLGQLSFRDSLRKLYSTERFQIVVVCLVVLDAIFVLCELLIDLSIIEADHHRIAPQVFHYLSLALLTFFMVELAGKIFAYRLEFLHHKFEVFDGIVVVVSFILDIIYISKEDAFDAMGLLILLRLWRVARIINGILVSVQNRANHRVEKLKEINESLVHQVNELKEQNTKMDQENVRLRALLKDHSIDF